MNFSSDFLLSLNLERSKLDGEVLTPLILLCVLYCFVAFEVGCYVFANVCSVSYHFLNLEVDGCLLGSKS